MRVLEDQVFSLACASRSNRFLLLRTPVYYYYNNPNSQTYKSVNRADDIIQCLNYAWDILKRDGDEVTRRYFDKEYLPSKIEGLLKELVKLHRKPQHELNSEISVRKNVKGLKEILLYYITKVFTI